MVLFAEAQSKAVLKTPLVLAVVLGCLSQGCSLFPAPEMSGSGPRPVSIVTWNVQALFDGEDGGTEYDEYRSSAGWTGEKYHARITALVASLDDMIGGGPDILALEELENESVLEDIARAAGSGYGYRYCSFANNSGMSLGLGILSRHPPASSKAHSVLSPDGLTPRPVLELRFELQGGPFVLFVCHWKSKLGNAETTEMLRRASARALVRRLRELEAEEPGIPAAVLGDLNENHDEFFRLNRGMVSALLPDDSDAAELAGAAQEDFLVLSRRKPPLPDHFPEDTVTLYSPWGEELKQGSYVYRNAWETIDHILLSPGFFDRQGWEFSGCEVLRQEPFTRASGYPHGYNPATGGGLSDHLPLLLIIER